LPQSSSESTDLARGAINGDELTVQLVRQRMPAAERTLHPTIVRILWPLRPTDVDAQQFPETAAALVRLFAEAHITLASIKARLGTPL
jgi:hypothetical protein